MNFLTIGEEFTTTHKDEFQKRKDELFMGLELGEISQDEFELLLSDVYNEIKKSVIKENYSSLKSVFKEEKRAHPIRSYANYTGKPIPWDKVMPGNCSRLLGGFLGHGTMVCIRFPEFKYCFVGWVVMIEKNGVHYEGIVDLDKVLCRSVKAFERRCESLNREEVSLLKQKWDDDHWFKYPGLDKSPSYYFFVRKTLKKKILRDTHPDHTGNTSSC